MAQNRRRWGVSLRSSGSGRNLARRMQQRRFRPLLGEWLEPRNLLASISGVVWNDVDGDGTQGAGESVQSGVTVYIDLNDNKGLDASEPTSVTGADGSYSFQNLNAGDYVIRAVTPASRQLTLPRASGQRLFTVITSPSPVVIAEINYLTGAVIRSFTAPGANGQRGLAFDGQTLYVMSDGNDTLYRLNPNTGTVLGSTQLATGNWGSIAVLKGQIYLTQNFSDLITVFDPISNQFVTTYDLQALTPGFNPGGALGESPATNELLDSDWHCISFIDAVTMKRTHTFGIANSSNVAGVQAVGNEIFVNHSSGDKIVEVYSREGKLLRTMQVGFGYTGTDLAGYADTSGAQRVTLVSNLHVMANVNFGDQSVLGSIRGTRWQDANQNSTRDSGEPVLAGKTVYLDTNDNGVRDVNETTATTASDGTYAFNNLPAGNYIVRESLDAGASQTYPYAIKDRLFVHGYVPSKIYEINPATGATLNTFNAPYNGYLDLAFDGKVLYAVGHTQNTLWKINPDTGDILASAALPAGTYAGLAYVNGLLYSYAISPNLRVIDPVTMQITGTLPVVNSTVGAYYEFGQMTGPTAGSNRLLGTGLYDDVIQIDPATGGENVTFQIPSSGSDPLTGFGSKVYACDSSDNLRIYSSSGTFLQSIPITDCNSIVGYPGTGGAQRVTLAPGQIAASFDFGTTEATPFNQPPTLTAITNLVTVARGGSATVNLTGISAGPFETQNISITAQSGNPALFPDPTVNYISAQTTGSLSFTLAAGQIGTAVITVTVKDDAGTANGGNDTLTRTITVLVNDPPILDAAKTPTLPTLLEDAAAPTGPVGTLVSNVVDFASPTGGLDNVTDIDSGTQLGIAVTAADSNLTCFYSLDGGTGWTGFGNVSDTNARLITADSDNRIYCQPLLNRNGAFTSALTFRAWDRTTGTDGGTADTTPNGGTTFSAATDGVSLTVTPVNDAPTATSLNSAETYTEDTAKNLTNILVSDVDSTTVTATLTISNPSAGSISTATSGAVTSTYTAATGVWTASGAITNVNVLLSAATFTPAADFNANFTIATSVSDDLGATVSGSKAMTGTAVNDAPKGTSLSAAETYTEDTPLNLIDIVVSDVDNAPLTVKLTLSNINAGSLSVATSGAVTSTYNATTGVWTASGAIANVNTLLAGVTFNPKSDFNGNFTIATNVSDGVATAVTGSKSMTGTAVNDAPTATNLNAAESFTEDTALNFIDMVVSDVDSTAVIVTLALSNANAGSLNTGTSGAVTSTYTAATGVWTASGVIANVNTLLAALVFTPVQDFNGSFTIAVTLSDNLAATSTGTKTITGIAANDAPTLDSAKTQLLATLLEDPGTPSGAAGRLVSSLVDFAVPSGEVDNVTDVDSGALLGMAITAVDPNLTCYYSLDGGSTWSGVGTVSTASARLIAADSDNMIYCQPGLNLNGTFASAITFRAWDRSSGTDGGTANITTSGGISAFSINTETISLIVTPVNDAPTATNMNSAESYTEDTPLNLTDIVVADVDTTTLTVTLSLSDATAGTLSTGTSEAVTSTFNAATGIWIATGPITNLNTLLAGVAFIPALNFNGNFFIATSVNDGDAPLFTGNKALLGIAVDDAPTATNLNAPENYTEDTPLDMTDIVVADVDSTTLTATLTLLNTESGSLSTATSSSTTSTFAPGTGVWTASGPIADVNALLGSVSFVPALDFNGSFTIATNVSDGIAGAITASKAVTGIAVNDAPTATNLSADEAYTEDATLNLADIVVTDADSATITAKLTLSTTSAGSLSTATSGTVTSTYSSSTGVWSASGAIASVNELLAGVSFTPALNFNGTFTIATSVSDGVAAAITGSKTITGSAVNDAPVLNSGKSPALPQVLEDSGVPSGAVGGLVSSLVDLAAPFGGLDNVTEADISGPAGIAVVDVDPSITCFFSLDGGASWSAIGSVTTASARLLAADIDNRVYCQAGPNLNGNFASAFTLRVWDQTSGSDGNTADTTTNGGTTAFSAATDGVGVFVQAVNDAPISEGATATLPSTSEDLLDPPAYPVANLFGSVFRDSDGTTISFGGVAIIASVATSAQGTWQFQIGSGPLLDFPVLADASAVIVLSASDRLRFVPARDFNGSPGGLIARLWDGTGGFHSSDLVQDIGASIGGSGGFSHSVSEVTLSTAILPVNDPPILPPFGGSSTAADENPQTRGPALQKTEFGWAQNFSAGASFETSQKLTFQVTNNNNGLFAAQPTIDSQGTLTYTPKPNTHGTATVTVVLKDDAGGNNTSTSRQFDIVITKTHPLHNAAEAGQRNGLDVTGASSALPDGSITAGDVLAVINYINAQGPGHISAANITGPPYCDVNGDDRVVAEDALKIINYINANSGQPEVEFSNSYAAEPAPPLGDLLTLLAADISTATSRRRRAV